MTTIDGEARESQLAQIVDLFERHADSVFHVAWRILWSAADAEDVTQTTFVRAFTRLHQLRDAGRERPWLLQIAYHSALEVLRRRRDVPTDPSELPDRPDRADTEGVADRRATAALLQAAIDELPGTLRLAFVLRDVEGLSTREVADTLEIGESAAKMRIARAREQLRLALEGVLA